MIVLHTVAMPEAIESSDTHRLIEQRMQLVAELHRLYAHDLRAPLNAIQLSVELLSATLADAAAAGAVAPASWERHVGIIKDELTRLNRLIESTLERRDGPSSCDLRSVIAEIGRLMKARARRAGLEVDIAVPEEALALAGERESIELALLDVIGEVMDAAPSGSRVALRSAAEGNQAVIHIEGPGGNALPRSARWRSAESALKSLGGTLDGNHDSIKVSLLRADAHAR
jgi:signal transduction histidine kinase